MFHQVFETWERGNARAAYVEVPPPQNLNVEEDIEVFNIGDLAKNTNFLY
jgi:hypothetical protein